MKDKEMLTRKKLRKKLSANIDTYLEGLSEKKKEKFEKFIDGKLKSTMAFYKKLSKKKKVKRLDPVPAPIAKEEAMPVEQALQFRL